MSMIVALLIFLGLLTNFPSLVKGKIQRKTVKIPIASLEEELKGSAYYAPPFDYNLADELGKQQYDATKDKFLVGHKKDNKDLIEFFLPSHYSLEKLVATTIKSQPANIQDAALLLQNTKSAFPVVNQIKMEIPCKELKECCDSALKVIFGSRIVHVNASFFDILFTKFASHLIFSCTGSLENNVKFAYDAISANPYYHNDFLEHDFFKEIFGKFHSFPQGGNNFTWEDLRKIVQKYQIEKLPDKTIKLTNVPDSKNMSLNLDKYSLQPKEKVRVTFDIPVFESESNTKGLTRYLMFVIGKAHLREGSDNLYEKLLESAFKPTFPEYKDDIYTLYGKVFEYSKKQVNREYKDQVVALNNKACDFTNFFQHYQFPDTTVAKVEKEFVIFFDFPVNTAKRPEKSVVLSLNAYLDFLVLAATNQEGCKAFLDQLNSKECVASIESEMKIADKLAAEKLTRQQKESDLEENDYKKNPKSDSSWIIAIVVIVILIVLALLGVGFWFIIKRREKKNKEKMSF